MAWTPLHAALGENTTDLTFEMVERAVRQSVEETAQLDWKDRLPFSTNSEKPTTEEKQAKAEELAKDVAAMANSGGGLIVYGMDEENVDGREAASRIVPVGEVTSDTERDIRAAANNLIYPPVVGVEFFRLHPDGELLEGVLALLVPDSQDAPHLVHPKKSKDWFQAPWRDGPHTRFMGERQLADAYRRREQGRREHEAELGDLFERFAAVVGACAGADAPAWVIAVARPVRPVRKPNWMTVAAAERIFAQAKGYPWVNKLRPIQEAADYGHTRRGLKLQHRTSARESHGRTVRARLEAHDDGSLAFGITRDGLLGPDDFSPGEVPADDLENVALDLAAAILELQRLGGPTCDYEMQIAVTPTAKAFRLPSWNGWYQAAGEDEQIHEFRPVRGTLVSHLGLREMLAGVVDVISDAMDQAGTRTELNADELEAKLTVWRATQMR